MKGTTLQCLEHYLQTLPWEVRGCEKERKPLAEFVGVSMDIPRRWLKDEKGPGGLRLIKLRYFLESKGYEVTELAKIQEPVRSVGKLIAFGKIGLEEMSSTADFSHVDELVKVLHGNRGISSAKRKVFESICGRFGKTVPKRPVEKQETEKIPMDADPKELLGLLQCHDALFDLLEPKLKLFLSDNVTPEQRRELRERAGRKLIFDLANRFYSVTTMLNSLCSEKTREINKNKNKEIQ